MTRARLRLTLAYSGLLAVVTALLLGASYLLIGRQLHASLASAAADDALDALGLQYALGLLAVVLLAIGGAWLVAGEVLSPIGRAMDLQRRFIANASHELRTPMTAVTVAADVALGDPDPSVASLRQALRAVVDATEETDALLAALLALASVTDTPRTDQVLDLAALVRAALPDDPRIAAHTETTSVRGDPALLRRATQNLVDNALRHGSAARPIEVSVADGTLTVISAGPRIDPADLPRLTQPFERLRRDSASGSGLGLSIVDAIAASHGGRLTLEPRSTGGLTARLAIPMAAA